MKILVIGATGMLGAPVAQALQAAGHTVRVLSRDPQKARSRLGEAFEFAAGDVENPASYAMAAPASWAVNPTRCAESRRGIMPAWRQSRSISPI
jgi:nucleoside-diphosphate-sugar epimerase